MYSKIVNYFLFVIALFSLWAVLGAGMNIHFLMIDVNWRDTFVMKVNNTLNNIACGYLVTYITYLLTTCIPESIRKKEVLKVEQLQKKRLNTALYTFANTLHSTIANYISSYIDYRTLGNDNYANDSIDKFHYTLLKHLFLETKECVNQLTHNYDMFLIQISFNEKHLSSKKDAYSNIYNLFYNKIIPNYNVVCRYWCDCDLYGINDKKLKLFSKSEKDLADSIITFSRELMELNNNVEGNSSISYSFLEMFDKAFISHNEQCNN